MKEVIVLRHADRDGDALTPEGIAACSELAERIGPIAVAIASERNRTQHTAGLVSGQRVSIDSRANIPFVTTKPMLQLVQDTLNSLQDGERALIVSHDVLMSELKNDLETEGFDPNFYGFGVLQGMRIDEHLRASPFNL